MPENKEVTREDFHAGFVNEIMGVVAKYLMYNNAQFRFAIDGKPYTMAIVRMANEQAATQEHAD